MSAVSKSMLRQASLLYRVYQPNVIRQALAPFSTSARYLAESTGTQPAVATNEPQSESSGEKKSFDTIPVHLGPIAKVVMVLGGRYSRLRDVPDSIPNRIYQRTKDKFRARCVVLSVFGTALLAYVASSRGKHAQKEGKRYTDSVFEMHRGESRLHEQLEAKHRPRQNERYSPVTDEVK